MMNEVVPGIFQLTVPLPRNPLRALNAYLIKGENRHLLIDTGFDWPECEQALREGLGKLAVNLADVDFFITHVHGDHSGLVCKLADKAARVFASETDAGILKATTTSAYWEEIDAVFFMHGFPRDRSSEPGNRVKGYISGSDLNYVYVKEGDVLEVGPYRLTCIMTPGHSPGHVCLYEADHKYFFSGDHILGDISPNITTWPDMEDPLGQYLQSLDRVYEMDIRLVLPGHRSVIKDHRQRIDEIKKHHEVRLAEILRILEQGAMNSYEVAGFMTWDLTYEFWEEFPLFQKWFATGETIAHLEYLEKRGKIRSRGKGKYIVYELNSTS